MIRFPHPTKVKSGRTATKRPLRFKYRPKVRKSARIRTKRSK